MTDTTNIIETIKSLFGILENSERDTEAVRESLAELAKDPAFLAILSEMSEELGEGVHIHIHEHHTHFHNNYQPSRDDGWYPTYPIQPRYPKITWEEPAYPITVSGTNTWTAISSGDGEGGSPQLLAGQEINLFASN